MSLAFSDATIIGVDTTGQIEGLVGNLLLPGGKRLLARGNLRGERLRSPALDLIE